MPGDPSNPETPAAPEPAATPAAPQQDYAALQKQFTETQEQLKQVTSALAAMQQAPADEAPAPPPVAISPEFRTMAGEFFKQELAPFLQGIQQQVQAIGGWRSGQELRQLSSELDLPGEIATAATNLMQQYAQAGRPISHQTAVRQLLGEREENRLRQEAVTRRAKQTFNTSLMPGFTGSGGLPNLQPINGQRPKDNDIRAWQKLADENDLPLS